MNTTWKWKLGMLAIAALVARPAIGSADCRAASPDYTIALLELYTSEGCDSCPPADRWFSALDLGATPPRVAALAFHVDYWDRLGWHDRFDSSAFTQRQYEQMQRHDTAFVYTPQVLLQGTDFASWRSAPQPTRALAAINARPARATIELAAAPGHHAVVAIDVHVRVPQMADRDHAVVAVALVQSGLASDVKSGENAGKHLVHDHVVRAWRSGLAVGASGELRQRVELPLPADSGPMQIVAWAEDSANGDVLQALTLALCER
jgi:hypothetical protein